MGASHNPKDPLRAAWRTQYKPWVNQSSYSGCDIIPVVYGLDPTTNLPSLFVVGDITTLTYSIHRDKGAVRVLGRANPKGFTRGSRTCAGSMVFSVFDRRALWELSKEVDTTKAVRKADDLPGFDIILYFTNEYGQESILTIYNIEIMDEGQSHSVQDMYIENTMSFIAGNIDPIEPKADYYIPTGATFLSQSLQKRELRAFSPTGIPFDYSYLSVAATSTTNI